MHEVGRGRKHYKITCKKQAKQANLNLSKQACIGECIVIPLGTRPLSFRTIHSIRILNYRHEKKRGGGQLGGSQLTTGLYATGSLLLRFLFT